MGHDTDLTRTSIKEILLTQLTVTRGDVSSIKKDALVTCKKNLIRPHNVYLFVNLQLICGGLIQTSTASTIQKGMSIKSKFNMKSVRVQGSSNETIGHEERATPRATSRCHVYDAFTVASVVNTDCPTTIAERNTSNCPFKS